MNTTINKLELASELAEIEAQKEWERQERPENFYIEEHNGDTRLNAYAQDLFNTYYDAYLTIIEKTQTPEQNETHYFTVTDEEGRTAAVIQATTSKEFESLLMDCTREHHSYDDAALKNSLLINDFIGADKTVIVECINDGEESTYYDMRVESVLCYSNKPNQEKTELFQVLNKANNPAGADETNPDAIFLFKDSAETFINYLVVEADFNKDELKIVKL
tara:strand:- start:623 stop:1279 length:657 start_codon:yes stop_codon:yes gene_type:complete